VAHVDILETGQQQPRLPEAGRVRDQATKTPAFEAPFALTGQAARDPRGQQPSIFEVRDAAGETGAATDPAALPPHLAGRVAFHRPRATVPDVPTRRAEAAEDVFRVAVAKARVVGYRGTEADLRARFDETRRGRARGRTGWLAGPARHLAGRRRRSEPGDPHLAGETRWLSEFRDRS
jgi:hypothetical protein